MCEDNEIACCVDQHFLVFRAYLDRASLVAQRDADWERNLEISRERLRSISKELLDHLEYLVLKKTPVARRDLVDGQCGCRRVKLDTATVQRVRLKGWGVCQFCWCVLTSASQEKMSNVV